MKQYPLITLHEKNLNNETTTREIYTVSRLNQDARVTLENSFPLLWVQGEISNFTAHSSGHWYFSLKDDKAQISCTMFRGRNMQLAFKPAAGLQVIARAKLSLYEPRGTYQLLVDNMEPAGEGALRQAFEALKRKLAQEGLFNAEHKKPLPKYPCQVGIISSPTGAAFRDIVSVLRRRFPPIPIILYPAIVQGNDATAALMQAIKIANQRTECDVLILARGGGSLEDLWAFNDEALARCIFASVIPIVSGVGHEIDFTIADFVADYRAATPSAAAETVSPNQADVTLLLNTTQQKLMHLLQTQLHASRLALTSLQIRLEQRHPLTWIQQMNQRCDELSTRNAQAMARFIQSFQIRLSGDSTRLHQTNPTLGIGKFRAEIAHLFTRLQQQIGHTLTQCDLALRGACRTLDSVSPLATLQRGYSIITDTKNAQIIKTTRDLKPGDRLNARLAQGELECEVKNIVNEHTEKL